MPKLLIKSLHIFLADPLHFPCSLHHCFDCHQLQQNNLNSRNCHNHYHCDLDKCKDQLKRKG